MVRMTKSRWMRWVEHVTHIREKRNAYRASVGGKLKERDSFQNLGIDWTTILYEEVDLKGIGQGGWAGLIWLKTGTRGGLLSTEHV
jgi:hypothetical protein